MEPEPSINTGKSGMKKYCLMLYSIGLLLNAIILAKHVYMYVYINFY